MKRLAYTTLAFVAVACGAASTALAGKWSFSFGIHGPHGHLDVHHAPVYRARVYHAPPVHYDHVYHVDYYHWTPHLGYHSHGHVHYVPRYAPCVHHLHCPW